jgi:hypothetical protein
VALFQLALPALLRRVHGQEADERVGGAAT